MEAWREELYHHGIKGQKWGVRRYQNTDGTLTALGKKHNAQLKSQPSSGGGGGGLTDEEKKKLLEDKPEGVSDEFWLDFKAHGGSLDTFDEAARRKAKIYDMPVGEYQNVTGESGSTGIDWNKKQREVDNTLDRQDQNGVKTTTESQSQNGKSSSSARGKSSSAGNSEEDARRYGEVGTRHRGETLKDTTEMIVAAGHRKRAALTPQGRHEPDNAPASDSMDNRRYAATHTPRGRSAVAGNAQGDNRGTADIINDKKERSYRYGNPNQNAASLTGNIISRAGRQKTEQRAAQEKAADNRAAFETRKYAERQGKVAPNVADRNSFLNYKRGEFQSQANFDRTDAYWVNKSLDSHSPDYNEYFNEALARSARNQRMRRRVEGKIPDIYAYANPLSREQMENRNLYYESTIPRKKRRDVGHSEFTIGGNYLMHHGVKGQKWGIRRYQNVDGTLTAAGRRRARRDLSKNDRQRAYAIGRAELAEANYKASRLSDYKKEAEQERKNAEHYAERGRDLVNQFVKAGYNVKSKRVARGTTKLDEFNARTTWNIDKTNWLLRTSNNITISGGSKFVIGAPSGQAVRGINKYVPGTAYKIKPKKRD